MRGCKNDESDKTLNDLIIPSTVGRRSAARMETDISFGTQITYLLLLCSKMSSLSEFSSYVPKTVLKFSRMACFTCSICTDAVFGFSISTI